MSFYDIIKSLYQFSLDYNNTSIYKSELDIIKKSKFINENRSDISDDDEFIHTGYIFALQNGKLMELIYSLNDGTVFRQPRGETLFIPQILGCPCKVSSGYFNSYHTSQIITSMDINGWSRKIDEIDPSVNILNTEIRYTMGNKTFPKNSALYSLYRGTEIKILRDKSPVIHNRFHFYDEKNKDFNQIFTLSKKSTFIFSYYGNNSFEKEEQYDDY